MSGVSGNVVVITGASSGIGRAVAVFLMNRGYRVYGTSRKKPSGEIEAGAGGGFIRMLQLDVCSEESARNAVRLVLEAEGRIDVLINNAGMGIAGSIEDTSPEEAFKQFDVNFFGMHRMVREALPAMRKQGKGLIINISSVAAVFPIPYQAMYVASKAAIEAMSGCLRNELRPFGIKVALVEPGDTRTGFTGSRVIAAAADENSAYADFFGKSLDVMVRDETNGPDPVVVAREVYRVMKRRKPPVRVVVGLKYKIFVFIVRIIPGALKSFAVSKMYAG
jgi:short-subunit dehydrogenase